MPRRVPTVQWQIMVRQLPLLLLLFVVVLVWLGEVLKDVLFDANLEIANRSNTAIVHTIRASLLTTGAVGSNRRYCRWFGALAEEHSQRCSGRTVRH